VTPIEFLSFISGVTSGVISIEPELAARILAWMCRGAAFEPRLTDEGVFKHTVGITNVLNLKEFPTTERRN